jgi:hypothetical protein
VFSSAAIEHAVSVVSSADPSVLSDVKTIKKPSDDVIAVVQVLFSTV